MSMVSVHNEWDPLEEIIIGTARGARIPRPDHSLYALEFPSLASKDDIPSGPFPDEVLEETEDELSLLCEEITRLGIVVRRPEPRDTSAVIGTPDWQSDGFYDYCPRDCLLAVGHTIIESPMVLRSRFLESFAYRELLLEYFDSGALWISAPKPTLRDGMYRLDMPEYSRLADLEPAFDAANVLRLGTDILYQVSDSGNERGLRWLQSVLGDKYRVHGCRGLYAGTHFDSTIIPLRPGLVLLNPERVNEQNRPEPLRQWEHLWCPDLVDIGYTEGVHPASIWIGMNLLVIQPGLVVAEARQTGLLRLLERHGIDVIPLSLTHARTLGGGFHCASLDVRRTGELAAYR
jgi:glycine amidinotransferase/scyllo-inosamine-4-phosphate amidinotransferase 1